MQRKAVKLRPTDGELHLNLANMFSESGRQREALPAYRKAVSLQPDGANFLRALKDCLMAIDRPRGHARHHSPELEEAATIARRLFEIDPDTPETGLDLASILASLERLEEAEAVLRDTIARAPRHLASQQALVSVLMDRGLFDEVEALCREILERVPANPPTYLNLANIKASAIGDEDVARIRAELERSDLAANDKAALNFTLGRHFDVTGRPDDAFPRFAAANAAILGAGPRSANDKIRMMERIRDAFTPGLFPEIDGARDSEAPVFIIGMPRTGTSLLEQILASHPAVVGCGELGDLGNLAADLNEKGLFPEGIEKLGAAKRRELGRRYTEIVAGYAGAGKRAVDKMPGNFIFAGLIHLLLPSSPIIHCRRDPVATCFSNYTTPFTQPTGWTNDLEDLGRYYRSYEALMEHWHDILPEGRILDVEYEDLVNRPEPNIRRVLEYCGLPWDDNCLTYYRTPRNIRTSSAAQVRQPMMTGRSDKWRAYEKYLEPLLNTLGARSSDG